MTQQQTTDAELIEIAATAIFHADHEHYDPSDHTRAEAVIAAVQPIIEAQARAEGRRDMLPELINWAKKDNSLVDSEGWDIRDSVVGWLLDQRPTADDEENKS